MPPNWNPCVQYSALSDVGMRRGNNQDNMASVPATSEEDWLERGHLFMVADGMGAHAAGELASEIAAETIAHTYFKLRDQEPPLALRSAIEEANRQIHVRGQSDAEFQGMGTTASVLALLPQGALAAHVGDSRIYRLRDGKLEQLTFDHSLVWEMRHAGIQDQEVPSFVPKNVITRSLGPHPEVQVDLEGPFPLSVGDTFLLCTDGLTGQVKDEEIAAILSTLPLDEATRVLVDLANLRGGPDNITCIAVRVVGRMTTSAEIEPFHPLPEPSKGRFAMPLGQAAAWGILILCIAALVPLLLVTQVQLAAAALAGLIASALVLRFKYGVGRPSAGRKSMRFGRGPYTSVSAAPDDAIATSLAQLVQELRAAAMEKQWSIAWPTFEEFQQRAEEARQRKDFQEAVRQSCRAIRYLMDEVRRQRTPRGPAAH